MKTTYFSINVKYDIKAKLFEPENEVKGCIIAVHGFCGDMESSVITSLAERMTSSGYSVITFNFAGHGTSEADEYFNLSNCRDDLIEVFRFAENKYGTDIPKVFFSTSFGGYVTLLELGIIPKDVKIVLRAPAVNMKKSFENIAGIDNLKKADKYIEMGFDRKLRVPLSFYDELSENYILERNINREMLIIHGSVDDVVLPEDMAVFCKYNPLAELAVIEGADHRFKNEGELEKIINIAEEYIIG